MNTTELRDTIALTLEISLPKNMFNKTKIESLTNKLVGRISRYPQEKLINDMCEKYDLYTKIKEGKEIEEEDVSPTYKEFDDDDLYSDDEEYENMDIDESNDEYEFCINQIHDQLHAEKPKYFCNMCQSKEREECNCFFCKPKE
jgi:hypothetical protein